MSGATGGNGGNRGDGRDPGIREEERAREGRDVEKLLSNLRSLAKAEAAEMAAMPPDYTPPLSAEDRKGITDAILARQNAAEAGSRRASSDGVSSIDQARRRRRTRWLAVALPAAAAAALALALGPLSKPRFSPLPPYEVSATGGIKELRSGETGGLDQRGTVAKTERVGRKTELVVVGRPDKAVDGPVAARAFLVQGGRVVETRPAVEIAPSGAVEIRVRPGEAGADAAGKWMLRVLIGRPDAIASLEPKEATGTPSDPPGARWLAVPLDLVE